MGCQGNKRGSVYEQQGAEVEGSCHSKEGSKLMDKGNEGNKGNKGNKGSKGNKGNKGSIVYIVCFASRM
jgi:hypothetical protein